MRAVLSLVLAGIVLAQALPENQIQLDAGVVQVGF
jgi:hypothetical protein